MSIDQRGTMDHLYSLGFGHHDQRHFRLTIMDVISDYRVSRVIMRQFIDEITTLFSNFTTGTSTLEIANLKTIQWVTQLIDKTKSKNTHSCTCNPTNFEISEATKTKQ